MMVRRKFSEPPTSSLLCCCCCCVPPNLVHWTRGPPIIAGAGKQQAASWQAAAGLEKFFSLPLYIQGLARVSCAKTDLFLFGFLSAGGKLKADDSRSGQ